MPSKINPTYGVPGVAIQSKTFYENPRVAIRKAMEEHYAELAREREEEEARRRAAASVTGTIPSTAAPTPAAPTAPKVRTDVGKLPTKDVTQRNLDAQKLLTQLKQQQVAGKEISGKMTQEQLLKQKALQGFNNGNVPSLNEGRATQNAWPHNPEFDESHRENPIQVAGPESPEFREAPNMKTYGQLAAEYAKGQYLLTALDAREMFDFIPGYDDFMQEHPGLASLLDAYQNDKAFRSSVSILPWNRYDVVNEDAARMATDVAEDVYGFGLALLNKISKPIDYILVGQALGYEVSDYDVVTDPTIMTSYGSGVVNNAQGAQLLSKFFRSGIEFWTTMKKDEGKTIAAVNPETGEIGYWGITPRGMEWMSVEEHDLYWQRRYGGSLGKDEESLLVRYLFDSMIQKEDGSINWEVLFGKPDFSGGVMDQVISWQGFADLGFTFQLHPERISEFMWMVNNGATTQEATQALEDVWAEMAVNTIFDPLNLIDIALPPLYADEATKIGSMLVKLFPQATETGRGIKVGDTITSLLLPGVPQLVETTATQIAAPAAKFIAREAVDKLGIKNWFIEASRKSVLDQFSNASQELFHTIALRSNLVEGQTAYEFWDDIIFQASAGAEFGWQSLDELPIMKELGSEQQRMLKELGSLFADEFSEALPAERTLEDIMERLGPYKGINIKEASDVLQNDLNAIAAYLTQAATEKYARQLGVSMQPKGLLNRSLSWMGRLARENWLGANARYMMGNYIDNTVKTVASNYAPAIGTSVDNIAADLMTKYGSVLPPNIADTLVKSVVDDVSELATGDLPWPIGKPAQSVEASKRFLGLEADSELMKWFESDSPLAKTLNKLNYATLLEKGLGFSGSVEELGRANIFIQAFEAQLNEVIRPKVVEEMVQKGFPRELINLVESGQINSLTDLERMYARRFTYLPGERVPQIHLSELVPKNLDPSMRPMINSMQIELDSIQRSMLKNQDWDPDEFRTAVSRLFEDAHKRIDEMVRQVENSLNMNFMLPEEYLQRVSNFNVLNLDSLPEGLIYDVQFMNRIALGDLPIAVLPDGKWAWGDTFEEAGRVLQLNSFTGVTKGYLVYDPQTNYIVVRLYPGGDVAVGSLLNAQGLPLGKPFDPYYQEANTFDDILARATQQQPDLGPQVSKAQPGTGDYYRALDEAETKDAAMIRAETDSEYASELLNRGFEDPEEMMRQKVLINDQGRDFMLKQIDASVATGRPPSNVVFATLFDGVDDVQVHALNLKMLMEDDPNFIDEMYSEALARYSDQFRKNKNVLEPVAEFDRVFDETMPTQEVDEVEPRLGDFIEQENIPSKKGLPDDWTPTGTNSNVYVDPNGDVFFENTHGEWYSLKEYIDEAQSGDTEFRILFETKTGKWFLDEADSHDELIRKMKPDYGIGEYKFWGMVDPDRKGVVFWGSNDKGLLPTLLKSFQDTDFPDEVPISFFGIDREAFYFSEIDEILDELGESGDIVINRAREIIEDRGFTTELVLAEDLETDSNQLDVFIGMDDWSRIEELFDIMSQFDYEKMPNTSIKIFDYHGEVINTIDELENFFNFELRQADKWRNNHYSYNNFVNVTKKDRQIILNLNRNIAFPHVGDVNNLPPNSIMLDSHTRNIDQTFGVLTSFDTKENLLNYLLDSDTGKLKQGFEAIVRTQLKKWGIHEPDQAIKLMENGFTFLLQDGTHVKIGPEFFDFKNPIWNDFIWVAREKTFFRQEGKISSDIGALSRSSSFNKALRGINVDGSSLFKNLGEAALDIHSLGDFVDNVEGGFWKLLSGEYSEAYDMIVDQIALRGIWQEDHWVFEYYLRGSPTTSKITCEVSLDKARNPILNISANTQTEALNNVRNLEDYFHIFDSGFRSIGSAYPDLDINLNMPGFTLSKLGKDTTINTFLIKTSMVNDSTISVRDLARAPQIYLGNGKSFSWIQKERIGSGIPQWIEEIRAGKKILTGYWDAVNGVLLPPGSKATDMLHEDITKVFPFLSNELGNGDSSRYVKLVTYDPSTKTLSIFDDVSTVPSEQMLEALADLPDVKVNMVNTEGTQVGELGMLSDLIPNREIRNASGKLKIQTSNNVQTRDKIDLLWYITGITENKKPFAMIYNRNADSLVWSLKTNAHGALREAIGLDPTDWFTSGTIVKPNSKEPLTIMMADYESIEAVMKKLEDIAPANNKAVLNTMPVKIIIDTSQGQVLPKYLGGGNQWVGTYGEFFGRMMKDDEFFTDVLYASQVGAQQNLKQSLFERTWTQGKETHDLLNDWLYNIDQNTTAAFSDFTREEGAARGFRDVIDDAKGLWADGLEKASNFGVGEVNRILFDYSYKSNAEEMLRYYSPFTTWQLRNPLIWAQIMSQHPGMIGVAIRYQHATEIERRKRNLTDRFKGTIGFDVGNNGIIPEGYYGVKATPFMSLFTQFQEPFEDPTAEEFYQNQNGAQKFLQFLIQQGQTLGISPWPWVSKGAEMAGVLPKGSTNLSLGPVQRAAELGLQATGVLDPGEGLVPNKTSEWLTNYYVNRRISEMEAEGVLTHKQALEALNNPESEVWKWAQKDVLRNNLVLGAASLVSPLPVKYASEGELAIRDLKKRASTLSAVDKADLYMKNPALETYNLAFGDDKDIEAAIIYEEYDQALKEFSPWDLEYKNLVAQRTAEVNELLGDQIKGDKYPDFTKNKATTVDDTLYRLGVLTPQPSDYYKPGTDLIDWDTYYTELDDFMNSIEDVAKDVGVDITLMDYMQYKYRYATPEQVAYDLYKQERDNMWEEIHSYYKGGSNFNDAITWALEMQFRLDLEAGFTPQEAQSMKFDNAMTWFAEGIPYKWQQEIIGTKADPLNLSQFAQSVAAILRIDANEVSDLQSRLNVTLPGPYGYNTPKETAVQSLTNYFYSLTPAEKDQVSDFLGKNIYDMSDREKIEAWYTVAKELHRKDDVFAAGQFIQEMWNNPVLPTNDSLTETEVRELNMVRKDWYEYNRDRSQDKVGNWTPLMEKYYTNPYSAQTQFWAELNQYVLNSNVYDDPILNPILNKMARGEFDFTADQYKAALEYFQERKDYFIDPELSEDMMTHPDWVERSQIQRDSVTANRSISMEAAKAEYYSIPYELQDEWRAENQDDWNTLARYMVGQKIESIRNPYYLYFSNNNEYNKWYGDVTPDKADIIADKVADVWEKVLDDLISYHIDENTNINYATRSLLTPYQWKLSPTTWGLVPATQGGSSDEDENEGDNVIETPPPPPAPPPGV